MKIFDFIFPKIKRQINDIIKKINFIFYYENEKQILWSNEEERLYLRKNFGDVTNRSDFLDNYYNLVRGMDGDSRECISRIIYNIKTIVNSDDPKLDLFSNLEKEQIRELHNNFYSRIFNLTETIYAYKNFLLPLNHFEASVFYYKHGLESVESLDRITGSTIIDVGGYIGDSTLIFSELKPQQIISFEPVSENYSIMEKTIKLNNLSNITIEKKALGDKEGRIIINTSGSESSIINNRPSSYDGELEIDVTTLDSYTHTNNINNISLIKVDIEGAEQDFLRGAEQTIRQFKPILLISIYHNADDFFKIKPIIENWKLGYVFKIHKPIFENSTSETLLIAELPNC